MRPISEYVDVIEMALRVIPPGAGFDGPRAVCVCDHTGDGDESQHMDICAAFGSGHGLCEMPGCACGQFTWARWTPEFEQFLKLGKN